MSNFGKLGSSMVRNAISASDQGMQIEKFNTNAAARELDEIQNVDKQRLLGEAKRQAGGDDLYAKQELKRIQAERARASQLAELKLENIRAKNAKISAQALKAAFRGAATVSKPGNGYVPVQRISGAGSSRPASTTQGGYNG